MNLRPSHLCLFVLLIGSSIGYAQVDTSRQTPEDLQEMLLEQGTEDSDDEQLLDYLEALAQAPMNLSTATLEDLQTLPFLTPPLALAIIERRDSLGRFRAWSDLVTIPGMDDRTFAYLLRYTFISPQLPGESLWSRTSVALRSRAQQDSQIRRGFRDGSYPGSRLKAYNRLTVDYDKSISAGVLAEKDPGETSMTDHIGGYVSMRNLSVLDRVLVGDFTVATGQGVMFWRSFGFSKGTDVIAPTKRRAASLAPYLSSTETRYFRGAAAQTTFGNFEAMAFYSTNTLDGTVDTLSGEVTSFDDSGLHRTETERRKHNSTREQLLGSRLGTTLQTAYYRLNVGLAGYASSFSTAVRSSSPFGFTGSSSSMTGADFDLYVHTSNIFGEWVRAHNGAIGGVTGITSMLSPIITTTILYRRFPADFISLHGYAFGERNGATQNEEGIYLGTRLALQKNLTIQAYFDQFFFPNRTYFIDVPTSGNEFLAHVEWEPERRVLLQMRWKRENKEDEVAALDADGREIRPVTGRLQQNIRFELQYRPSRHVTVRSRVEGLRVEYALYKTAESGYLLFADARVEPLSFLSLSGRVTVYRTDSYDSRLYQFESDLRGVMTNIGLYGEGMRLYLLARLDLMRQIALSFKYAQTIQNNVRSIGSGRDEILGDTIGRVSMQMDVSL